MHSLIAFTPAASAYVHLLPLVLVISLVYSATRHEEWPLIASHAARLTVLILAFTAAVFVFLVVAPRLTWTMWLIALAVVAGAIGLRFFRRASQSRTP